VAALPHQVEVELAERGGVRVGVVDGEGATGSVVSLEPVTERKLRPLDESLEHPGGMNLGERLGATVLLELDRHARRARPVGAHDHSTVGLMGAEHRVRVRVLATDDGIEL